MARTRLVLGSLILIAACYDGSGAQFGAEGSTAGVSTEITALPPGPSPTSGEPGTGGLTTTGDVTTTSTTSITTTTTTTGEATTSTGVETGSTTEEEDPLAECPRLRVVVPQGEVLNVRPTPSTAEEPVATLPNAALVDTIAAVEGETIDGNSLWYQITSKIADGFVFSGFVVCTLDEHPPAPAGYFLPLQCGMQAKVTQGNSGGVSHQGVDLYAFDFGLGLNTPVVAMAGGVVQHIYDQTKPGHPCYNGGGPECSAHGNLVTLLHGDDTTTYYKHLNEVHVGVGQTVERGQVIGLSGSTGYSTGRHLHAARQGNCGQSKCQSIMLEFVEVGVPVTGQTVTSMNCP